VNWTTYVPILPPADEQVVDRPELSNPDLQELRALLPAVASIELQADLRQIEPMETKQKK